MGQKTGAKTSDILPQKMPQNSALSTVKKSQKKSQEIPPADDENFTFNPDDFGLTGQQGKFAQHVAMGKKLTDSYRLAGYECTGKNANFGASQVYRNIQVQRAIRWLRDRRQKRLALTEAEIIHQLSSIASADPNLISQIRRVNCRYCWGEKQGNRIHSTEGARTVTENYGCLSWRKAIHRDQLFDIYCHNECPQTSGKNIFYRSSKTLDTKLHEAGLSSLESALMVMSADAK